MTILCCLRPAIRFGIVNVMTIIIKTILIFLIVFILFALGSALYYLVTDTTTNSDRIVKALTWRIGLSLLLFVILMISFAMGWITPHNI